MNIVQTRNLLSKSKLQRSVVLRALLWLIVKGVGGGHFDPPPHFRRFLEKFNPHVNYYPLLPQLTSTDYTYQKGRLLKRNC